MKIKIVPKKWGREEWIVNNKLYCGKRLTIIQDKISSEGKFHYHKIKDETFFVLEGILLLQIFYGWIHNITLNPNDYWRIKPYIKHRFSTKTQTCVFIEFSTHHKDEDTYYEESPNKKTDDNSGIVKENKI